MRTSSVTVFVVAGSVLLGTVQGDGSLGSKAPFLEPEKRKLTPGKACDEDKELYERIAGATFEDSLEACSLAWYENSLLQPSMVGDVSDCMQNGVKSVKKTANETIKLYKADKGFSAACAETMGKLARCTSNECTFSCLAFGGSASPECRACTIEKCIPVFYQAAGIDTTCLPKETGCTEQESDMLPLIIGIAGGSAVLIFLVLVIQISRHNRALANERELFAQQLSAAAMKAPKIEHRNPQVSIKPTNLEDSEERPLRVIYAFLAEADTELSVMENEPLTGIKQVDEEWWLVRNAKGKLGLVPAGYCMDLSREPVDDKVEF